MALPVNTATVLKFLGHQVDDDFDVFQRGGVITLDWHPDPPKREPTEQEINNAATDRTLVNGLTFTQWASGVKTVDVHARAYAMAARDDVLRTKTDAQLQTDAAALIRNGTVT